MREILFRGKRIDNGEWVYGFYYVSRCKSEKFHFIWTDSCNNLRAAVHPETVGQYTGLTDKDGVKIFEGDICRFFNGEEYSIYEVVWIYHRWMVLMHGSCNPLPDDLDEGFCESAKVISNIYDNPEPPEVEE